jgi:alkanesulfonate monooxygenase SsuD/methylene tetrahydromethanopterin reductase-like flavin-dependent oxidoreductase (luciferase family)
MGSGSESMLRLCGELCDGVLPLRFIPSQAARFKTAIEEGFARAGNGKSWDGFCFEPGVAVTVTDDVKSALAAQKPRIALYVGGMGHPSVNFHKRAMEQLGFADAAARIEELFRSGRKDEAADAVPDEFVDDAALIGSPQRIRERYQAWADCGLVTGLHVGTQQPRAVELMAEIALADQPVGAATGS